MKDIPLFSSRTQKNIAKQVMLGFAIAIIFGSLLLMTPQATQSGKISYIDALFTSTTAICVTGLTVQNTATYFTDMGKIILLILMQIGGLGIMTFSLFHTVSAFNNAGLSIFTNNLEGFASDIPLNLVIMTLIILGGIGFPVISEIITYRRIRHFSLHSKIVMAVTGILIFTGAVMFFVLEFNNPESIANKPVATKILASFFQSVTARTAGFNTMKTGMLNPGTIFILTVFMFIDASPGGTGGGIKTTTFAAVAASGLSSIRGRGEVTLFKRKLPSSLVHRALTLTIIAAALVIISTIGILAIEKYSLKEVLFEVVSAFGTVGLSTGITPELSMASKIILILTMFIGRIGISTLSLAIAMRR